MRRSIRAALVMAVLLAAEAPAQDVIPRIVDVRIGQHRAFDRVVLELERVAPVSRLETPPGQDVVVELGARPLLPRQEIATGSQRFEWMILEATVDGTRLRLRSGQSRVRLFWLVDPVRLVVDVAEAGEAPFEPPRGAEAVRPLPHEAIEGVPPELQVGKVTPAEPIPTPEPLEEPGPIDLAPEAPPPPEELEPEVTAPAPVTPEEPAPLEPSPEQTAPAVALPPRPLPPELTPLPMPPSKPDRLEPEEPGYDRWLVLLVWIGGPLLLVGLALYLTRARRRVTAEPPEPRPPESITPGEVLSASDRLDLLEKRIDEEVRARMQLEHRVVMVQEDLKVVRDRVIRIGRRGEAAS